MTERKPITIGPRYRWYQRESWLEQERFNLDVWHRRAGKTVDAVKWTIKKVLRCPLDNPQGAYICPVFKQAKRVAWRYFKDFARPIGATFSETETTVKLPNGGLIYLLGSNDPDPIRGMYMDAVVCDEFAQFNPRAWGQVIRPTLSDRKGQAKIIGTVMGRANLFYEFYRDAASKPDWRSRLLTVEDTGIIDADEIASLKRDQDESDFMQEYMCDWDAAVKGSYYAAQMNAAHAEGRIRNVPHEPELLVHTSWDLGMADSTVIVFWQRTPTGELRAINCLEYQATGLPDIIADLRGLPYSYGSHIVPHDAKVRELGTGKSRVEVMRSLGLVGTVCKNHSVMDGISASRSMLSRVWFDETKCFRLIEALKTYRADYDDVLQVRRKQPLHSWESHFADAVRYFAMMEKRGLDGAWGQQDFSEMNRAVI